MIVVTRIRVARATAHLLLTGTLLVSCGRDRPPVTPDTLPPGAVADLRAEVVSPEQVRLRWTAPGDDDQAGRATRYEIGYARRPDPPGGFFSERTGRVEPPPPAMGGRPDSVTAQGLVPGTRLFFVLRAFDEAGQASPVSNVASAELPVAPDSIPPGAINTLQVRLATGHYARLVWKATGDDDFHGQATRYDLRLAVEPLTEENWERATMPPDLPVPGTYYAQEQYMLHGLVPGSVYYIAVRAVDEAGNRGPLAPSVRFEARPDHVWRVRAGGGGDFEGIADAVAAAASGDTVLVGPGEYVGLVDFSGKLLVLLAEAGPAVTTLRGGLWACVHLHSGETREAVIEGFHITGGSGMATTGSPGGRELRGGGLYLEDAEPTLRGNLVEGNAVGWPACNRAGSGGGLCMARSATSAVRWSPLVVGNTFRENHATLRGGGIAVFGGVEPEIVENRIEANVTCHGRGGGLWVEDARGAFRVEGNVLADNEAGDSGGGLAIDGGTGEALAPVRWNVFAGNRARDEAGSGAGGGALRVAAGAPDVLQNTLVGNGTGPGAVVAFVGDGRHRLVACLLAQNRTEFLVHCQGDTTSPEITDNLTWANEGDLSNLRCGEWSGRQGNFEADPLFCDPQGGDYRVAPGSPALSGGVARGAFPTGGCGGYRAPAESAAGALPR